MSLLVDIHKKLGDFSLDISFEADREILALLGASGCGKSMTLKCIAGIETPDRGKIILNGRVLFDSEKHINLTPQKRRIGYLFQQYALFPNMTVEQNIAAGIRDASRSEKKALVTEKIQIFRLEGLEKKRPHQLSGGQQQRVALARILASNPQVILLDEPFSALDSYLKWQLEMELSDMLEAFPGIVIWVSHDRSEVYRNCGRVCIMDNGTSFPITSMKELFKNPVTVSAATLSGCKNYAAAIRTGTHSLFVPDWNISLQCEEPADLETFQIGIRAHYFHIAEKSEPNLIPCRILRSTEDVFSTIWMLLPTDARPDAPQIRMELDKSTAQRYHVNDIVTIWVAPKDILILRNR